MGLAARDVIPLLTAVGDTASALGAGSEGVNRITLALGQMATRTKVTAQDMLQLTEVGVPAWRILAEATGQSIAQVQDAAEKGTISAQTFIQAFQRFSATNFGGLMQQQSQTFIGAVSNIRDQVRLVISSAFEPLFNSLRDLAADLPRLWHADTTSPRDRKRLLRTLIADVTLLPEDDPHTIRVGVRWQTGAADELTVARPGPGRTPDEALELIRRHGATHTSAQLADMLNAAGLRTGRGHRWTERAVAKAGAL